MSRAFNVNPSLIRFWEKEFSIIQPKKNKKGNRFFTPKDIENLRVIYHLVKERGYTLEGAKIALEEQKGLVEEIEVITRLENVKAELLKIKESLDDMNDE